MDNAVVKRYDIKVDIFELTLGDVEKLMEPDPKKVSFTERLDILQRLVPEVPMRELRLKDLKDLMSTVEEALEAEVNPLMEKESASEPVQ